jgi:hypothetical protein
MMMMKKNPTYQTRLNLTFYTYNTASKVPHTTVKLRNHGYIASTGIGEKTSARLLSGMDTRERKYHVPCTNGEDGENGGDGEESLHRKR